VAKERQLLDIAQVGRAMPRLSPASANRPHVKAVFMLHDVIPMEQFRN